MLPDEATVLANVLGLADALLRQHRRQRLSPAATRLRTELTTYAASHAGAQNPGVSDGGGTGSSRDLDTTAAAQILGISAAEVRRRCREGKLAARQVAGRWIVDLGSV